MLPLDISFVLVSVTSHKSNTFLYTSFVRKTHSEGLKTGLKKDTFVDPAKTRSSKKICLWERKISKPEISHLAELIYLGLSLWVL